MKWHWWEKGGKSNRSDQPLARAKEQLNVLHDEQLETELSQTEASPVASNQLESSQAEPLEATAAKKSGAKKSVATKPKVTVLENHPEPGGLRLAYLSFLAIALAVPGVYWLKPAISSLAMQASSNLSFNLSSMGAVPVQPDQSPIAAPAPTVSASPVVATTSASQTCPVEATTEQPTTALADGTLADGQLSEQGEPEIQAGIQPPSVSEPINFPTASSPASPTSNSANQIATGLTTVGNLGAALAAQSASKFPQVNGMARLARVPIIMYHDILPEKQVFFDVTPTEFEDALKLIQQKGLTPISVDQLVTHLSTGMPLPAKPILLSFDDGYAGHYTHVYPLLKKYGYPALFAIYTAKVDKKLGRSSLTWQQIREMAADPLITIAAHSITHPRDLTTLTDAELRNEIVESKRILETQLNIPIHYFVYPEGKYDERTQDMIQLAGYRSAFKMDDTANRFAGASKDLYSIERIGQSALASIVDQAYGGPPLPQAGQNFQFDAPVQLTKTTVGTVPLIFASGGRPVTIHAESRYQVGEIIEKTNALAAVDGGFFSLEYLDSNVMVGPVFSQSSGKFAPGNVKEIRRIQGRPLVLISPTEVKYVPFDPTKHNDLAGLKAELPGLTDAFVAAAWLVKDGKPQPATSFGNLFDFDAARDRAYWGIDQAGRTVVGVSGDYVDSIALGEALSQAGLRDAVMVDSGASASLVYLGKSQMSYDPRPVPHVVAIVPPSGLNLNDPCKQNSVQAANQ